MFIMAKFIKAKLCNQPRSINGHNYNGNMVFYMMENYLAIRNAIIPFADKWMEQEIIIVRKVS